MNALLCAAMLLFPGTTADVVVQKGEGWEALATRVLGSPLAASELKALNPEAPGAPLEGARLRLPGPDRGLAVHAISSARSALAQASPEEKALAPAREKLQKAETLLRSAHYGAAAQEADSAWRLVSQSPSDASRFAVEVKEDGRTKVRVQRGQPVRVEAEGTTQSVSAGEGLEVAKGSPPPAPTREEEALGGELPSPELLRPAPFGRVNSEPNADGLAPVRVAWRPVSGAHGYSVEVVPPKGSSIQTIALHVTGTEVSLPPLPAGTYRWRVRALGDKNVQGLVAERTFQLSPAPLKLEVKESTWK